MVPYSPKDIRNDGLLHMKKLKEREGITYKPTYAQAMRAFNRLPHVNDDQLRPDDIAHLVFRAQHELDILHEGEWLECESFTAAEQWAIRRFILRYGTPSEIATMHKDTPNIVKHRKQR